MIRLEHISKAYEGRAVLEDFTVQMECGGIYCLSGASGIGKTTFLRILMGLEQPDAGRILCDAKTREACAGASAQEYEGQRKKQRSEMRSAKHAGIRIGAVFQEDRLLEFADALTNVRLTAQERGGGATQSEEILSSLLEQEAWGRPVLRLSGGMRRRVAIARALAAPCELLVMDEPFAGLDDQTKRRTICSILQYRKGRTLLVVTHQEEDCELLGADAVFRL
ncbi:MAG: ATP-binding cassette domain-containing protein [Lachnospiraceae bacterium]|uniref:ATP-binding cassette domain-containing protein n=1 Tax=Parablautia sp. Marseille-Q6255 TaxID=3039593 RepID=UPI0024BD4D7E|nr:ATP-binding cassette domain-containing protein [Parablautia sp. Marseille-Q6255]